MACLPTNARPPLATPASQPPEQVLKQKAAQDARITQLGKRNYAAAQAAPQPFVAKLQENNREIAKRVKRALPAAQSPAKEQNEKAAPPRLSVESLLKMRYSDINLIDIDFLEERPDNPLRDVCVGMSEEALVDAGRSIFTDFLRPCIALVARCYKDDVLISHGICHLDSMGMADLEGFLKKIKDKNFSQVEFKLIGGYESTEVAEEIEGSLHEAGYPGPFEKVLNPLKVIDDFDDDERYTDLCSLLKFAVSAGITKKGYVYYAYDSLLKKYDKKTIRTLHHFYISNEAKLQGLAETCKKDPLLQTFWLELVAAVMKDTNLPGEAKKLKKGLELFKGFLE